jgi:hypothetical protein
MAKQLIDVGVNLNDGTGDNLRTAGEKINSMMSEIYSTFGNGTVLTATINGLQNVSDDDNPQLGGLLDLNGYAINGIGEVFITGRIATGGYIEAGDYVRGNSLQVTNNATVGGSLTVNGVTTGTVGNFTTSVTTGTLNATTQLQVVGNASVTGTLSAQGAGSKVRFYYADSNAFPAAADWEGGLAYSEAANKMSVATDGAWKTLANEDSPALSGTPTAPTAATATNTTQIATTAYVQAHRGEINTALDLKAPLDSPALTGTPTAPTAAKTDNDTSIATTKFVKDVVADYAPLNSPELTGTPRSVTPSPADDNSTKIATTAFVAGREEVIQGKLDKKADIKAPALESLTVGNTTTYPTTPTVAANINSTVIASTAYVTTAVGAAVDTIEDALDLKAPLNSPTFTGTPKSVTPAAGDNTTNIATTAFVKSHVDSAIDGVDLETYAKIASPTFTGTPKAPTATAGTNTTQLATTAFVSTAVGDAVTNLNIGNYAPIDNPGFTGSPTAPTAPVNDNSTKIANTTWVQREFGYANVPMWGGSKKHVSESLPSTNDGSNGDLWFQTGTDSNVTLVSAVDWANVLNKPSFFNGSYNSLSDRPTLFSGAWADISGKPTELSMTPTPVYDNGIDWGYGTYGRTLTFRVKWGTGYDARELLSTDQFVVKIALFDSYSLYATNTTSRWSISNKYVNVYRNGYTNFSFTIQSDSQLPSPNKITLTIYKIASPEIHSLVLLSNTAFSAPTYDLGY